MISFSDQQLDMLKRAAALLPPHRRGDFLRQVARRLADAAQSDPLVVHAAMLNALDELEDYPC
jgi:hypothetical protein